MAIRPPSSSGGSVQPPDRRLSPGLRDRIGKMISRALIIGLAVVAAFALLAGPGSAQDVMKVIRGNYDRQQLDWFQYNFGLGGRREAAPPPQQFAPKPKKPRARVSPFEVPRP